MENTPSKIIKSVVNGVIVRQSLSEIKQINRPQTKECLVAKRKLGKFRTKVMAKTNEFLHKLANTLLLHEDYQTTIDKLMNLEAESKASFKI